MGYLTSEGEQLDNYADYSWYKVKILHRTEKAILAEMYKCKDINKPTRVWVPFSFIAKELKDGDGFQIAIHYSFDFAKYITRTHYKFKELNDAS